MSNRCLSLCLPPCTGFREQPTSPGRRWLNSLPDCLLLIRGRRRTGSLAVCGGACFADLEPDPGIPATRVEEALADKAVRPDFYRPLLSEAGRRRDTVRPLSYNDLQRIAPLDMLKHAFTSKYGGELPEDIESLFNDVMREVSL